MNKFHWLVTEIVRNHIFCTQLQTHLLKLNLSIRFLSVGNRTLSDAGSSHYRNESRSYHPAQIVDNVSAANPASLVVHRDNVLGDSLVVQDAEFPKALSYKTQQNIAGAVASFWRWSRQIELPTDRQLFEIPPQELDGYLAQFFQAAKKPNGEDYNARSLISIRTHLSRYLRDNNYSECIAQSPLFRRSQWALKLRSKSLG